MPQPVWKLLEEDRYVSDALDPDVPEGREDLLERTRRQIRLHREMLSWKESEGGTPTESSKRVETGLVSPAVEERANACLPYLLKRHSRNWAVKDIRRKIGAPLSREAATQLLNIEGNEEALEWEPVWNGEEVLEIGMGSSDLLRYLVETAKYLYGPWHSMDAAWWILTDEPPRISAMQGEIMGYGWDWPMVTLRVPVWASTPDVAQFYARVKQGRSFRQLHDPAPTPSSRRLAVFRFVSDYSDFDKEILLKAVFQPRMPWRELMQLWNQQPDLDPSWHYEDPRNFRRDFVKTRDALFSSKD